MAVLILLLPGGFLCPLQAIGKNIMRKLCILLLLLSTTTERLWAQLPSGSVAPDFIAQDLSGQSWHLYDLLDQGKIVVLEISATWCAPCWAYHNGHSMHNFYAQHGPDGDDRARVLFIEGDPKTNVSCLYGPVGCNDYTPGNWVSGTPFPIINDDSISQAYQVDYYPTLFVICPNRKAYEVGQWDAPDIWAQALTCPVASGVNNAGIFDYSAGTPLREVCAGLEVKPEFSLVNLGSEALTQATVALHWNNTLVQQIEWSGALNLYEDAKIAFDPLPLNEGGNLSTRLVGINNGVPDDDTTNNVRQDSFGLAREFNTLKVLLKIKTDQYGAETYWELRDQTGATLESGGNKAVGPNGGGMFTGINGGPGAYSNNTIIRDTLNLPGPGCYSIHFVDYYGDGMCCDYGNGYFKLYNLDNPSLPVLSGGVFRAYDDRAFSAGAATAVTEPVPAPVLLYPNPANQYLHLDLDLPAQSEMQIGILNALGQVVGSVSPESLPAGEHQRQIDVQLLPRGLYWLRIDINGIAHSYRFTIQRS